MKSDNHIRGTAEHMNTAVRGAVRSAPLDDVDGIVVVGFTALYST